MDFFKSVFSAEPTSPGQKRSPPEYPQHSPEAAEQGEGAGVGGRWRGLIQTFASRSESVIQTYRRDLEEFGSGLKKETAAFREAATRAVLDLPGSLEAGASVAQESLESVGQAIDDLGGSVWRGTAGIISQGKEAILSMEAEASRTDQHSPQNETPSSKRYSRFEAQVLAIQSDANTFSEQPEDAQDFNNWRSGFNLAEKEDEIEKLCFENGILEGFLEKMVPQLVDYETFWCRYYYRVHKLKQVEDARAELVKRAIAREEEEDLSWEVEDDDDVQNEEVKKDDKVEIKKLENNEIVEEERKDEVTTGVQIEDMNSEPVGVEKQSENPEASMVKFDEGVASDAGKADETKKVVHEEDPVGVEKHAEVPQVEKLEASTAKFEEGVASNAEKEENPELTGEGMNSKLDDKTVQERKTEASGQEEDDLDWDEIEDLAEHVEKKTGDTSEGLLRVDLRKRLSAAKDDEDLSWDIEDDDEPTKP